jgi:hypothetical protein
MSKTSTSRVESRPLGQAPVDPGAWPDGSIRLEGKPGDAVTTALLLAAALSSPPAPSPHELTAAVGWGTRETQPILVVSWTGRRRWGGWFRVDHAETSAGPVSTTPGTSILTSAASIGVAWRALSRLTVGIGYGQKEEKTSSSGAIGLPRRVPERRARCGGDRDLDLPGERGRWGWRCPPAEGPAGSAPPPARRSTSSPP